MDFKKIIADKKKTKLLVPILGVLGMLLHLIVKVGFYGVDFGSFLGILIGSVFYIVIVSGAFLFDVYRYKIPAIVCSGLVIARGLFSGLGTIFSMFGTYRYYRYYDFGDWAGAVFHLLMGIAVGVILLLFVLRDRTKKSTIWLIVTGALAVVSLLGSFIGIILLLVDGLSFKFVFAEFLLMVSALLTNAMHPAGYLFEKPETAEEAAAGKAEADRKLNAVKSKISSVCGNAVIKEESIPLQIVLTIVTCGIYNFVWLFQLCKGVLSVCDEEDKLVGEYLLLILVPFYSIFWYYKRGGDFARSAQAKGYPIEDQSTIFLILSLFGFGIVNAALIQDGLNKIARANGNGMAVRKPVVSDSIPASSPVQSADYSVPVRYTAPEHEEVSAHASSSVAEMGDVDKASIGASGVYWPEPEAPAVVAEPAAPAQEETSGDGYEVLRNLARLHEMGILTDDEFATKKAEILSRM